MGSALISDPLLYEINPDDNLPQLRVSARGSFSFEGLSVGLKNTTLDIGDTATALPITPFAGRNSLTLLNKSTEDTLYIGNSDVTADNITGNTSGLEVLPGQSFNIDIKGSVVLYGRAEAGKTIRVKITEVA